MVLLTITETAKALRVSRSEVYRLVNRGVLPAVRLSSRITRIPAAAVERLIATAMSEER